MVENPIFVLLIVIALIILFLAIFVIFTYFLLKMAISLKREEGEKK